MFKELKKSFNKKFKKLCKIKCLSLSKISINNNKIIELIIKIFLKFCDLLEEYNQKELGLDVLFALKKFYKRKNNKL